MVTMAVMQVHDDSLVLDRIGSNAYIASLFDCSSQYVSKWRRLGIPRPYRMYLELRFPSAFGNDCPSAPHEPEILPPQANVASITPVPSANEIRQEESRLVA